MLLSVNMIVKDEADHLPDALASVRELADEVVVHDTGSTDDSVAIARRAGARVLEGRWDHDFARARNAALRASRGAWVLQLDADERWAGDAAATRHRLAAADPGEAFAVRITNAGAGNGTHLRLSLFARAGSRWQGRVHEHPVGPLIRTVVDLPGDVAALDHLGYADAGLLQRKGERNAALAQAEFDRLLADGCRDVLVLAPVLCDLGRSLLGAGRRQDAVDAFEAVRGLAPGTPAWAQATDLLARVLGGAGEYHAVLVLADELRAAGASAWADWLDAQALVRLGRPAEALERLGRIGDGLVDASGRQYDLAQVAELRAVAAALTGDLDAAVAAVA